MEKGRKNLGPSDLAEEIFYSLKEILIVIKIAAPCAAALVLYGYFAVSADRRRNGLFSSRRSELKPDLDTTAWRKLSELGRMTRRGVSPKSGSAL